MKVLVLLVCFGLVLVGCGGNEAKKAKPVSPLQGEAKFESSSFSLPVSLEDEVLTIDLSKLSSSERKTWGDADHVIACTNLEGSNANVANHTKDPHLDSPREGIAEDPTKDPHLDSHEGIDWEIFGDGYIKDKQLIITDSILGGLATWLEKNTGSSVQCSLEAAFSDPSNPGKNRYGSFSLRFLPRS